MFSNAAWAETMARDLLEFFPADARTDEQVQPRIRLPAYPADVVNRVLANETSHQLLEMAHIDKHGYPFITVMGFVLIDGKVHLGSRRNGLKLQRLRENPSCSMNYHNRRSREQLACLTLVGRAKVVDDGGLVQEFNRLLTKKTISDDSPDVGRRAEMAKAMDAARRVVIVLDDVDAVYIQAPPAPGHRIGTPSRVISWRAGA